MILSNPSYLQLDFFSLLIKNFLIAFFQHQAFCCHLSFYLPLELCPACQILHFLWNSYHFPWRILTLVWIADSDFFCRVLSNCLLGCLWRVQLPENHRHPSVPISNCTWSFMAAQNDCSFSLFFFSQTVIGVRAGSPGYGSLINCCYLYARGDRNADLWWHSKGYRRESFIWFPCFNELLWKYWLQRAKNSWVLPSFNCYETMERKKVFPGRKEKRILCR